MQEYTQPLTPSSDPIAMESNLNSVPTQPPMQTSKPNLLLIVIAGILLLGLVGFGAYFLGTKTQERNSNQSNPTAVVEKIPNGDQVAQTQQKITTSNTFAFIRDLAVYIHTDGSSKKVSKQDEAVQSIDYDAKTNSLVYTWGKLETNENGYKYVYPHTVTLVDLNTQETSVIYHEGVQSGKELGNGEYILQVRGVAFDDDGKTIAVTTSDSIYRYDVDQKDLATLWTNRSVASDWKSISAVGKSQIYGYTPTAFSPDGKYLLAHENYYEWSHSILVDVQAKQLLQSAIYDVSDFPLRTVGWLDGTTILLTKSNTGRGEHENTHDSIISYNIHTQEVTDLHEFDGSISAPLMIEKKLFFELRKYDEGASSHELVVFNSATASIEKSLRLSDPNVVLGIKKGFMNQSLLLQVGNPTGSFDKSKIYQYDLLSEEMTLLEDGVSF